MWVRDLDHNPDPLSPAQAELVARVNAAGLGARQQVVDGELYYWQDSKVSLPSPGTLAAASRALAQLRSVTLAAASLDVAIEHYLAVYRVYVEVLRPAIRAGLDGIGAIGGDVLAGVALQSARRDQALWELGDDPSDARLAAYQAQFGSYSPVWDVAVPTDAERPDRVLAMAALWRGREQPLARQARAQQAAETALAALPESGRAAADAARAALSLADADDEIFFAAQHHVRRAWLAEGDPTALIIPPRAAVASPQDPAPQSLRGLGIGQAEGRARVVRSLDDLPTTMAADTILILPAFLPSHTFLLAVARAIVVETGGLLCHAAVVAREYGVPHLVGCRLATQIPDGTLLRLDGAGHLLIAASRATRPPPATDGIP